MWRRSSIQSLSPGVFCCFKFSKLPPIKSCPESASGLRNDSGVCACVSIVIEYLEKLLELGTRVTTSC